MAIDFSAYSLYAARVALSIVAPDALIYLVHVRPRPRFRGPASAQWEHHYADVVPALLEDVRDRLDAPPDMQVETIVLSGAASPALIEFAESANADLIVSGSHGYGFLNRLVLGSIATELLHGASASLLCVPGSAMAHAAARDEQSSRLGPNALGRGDWMHTLVEFSHRFAGERCMLEWRPAAGSARTIELGHPFVGASYDDRDDAVTLMTGTGRREGPHATHFVSGVRGIDELRTENGELRGLRVSGRHGATTLRMLP
jgi:nucleotide-binding universal stress UspA family protein